MNEIMVFEDNEVEVFELNNEIYFNPKHVANCLDIADANSSIRDFNENQIKKLTNSDVHTVHIRTLNNAGENFLTEAGVYKLIFKSRKPEAEKFQDWVTDEVLPKLRKTGEYKTKEEEEKPMLEYEIASRELKAAGEIAKFFGLQDNQMMLSANTAVKKRYNIDCMNAIGLKGLENKNNKQYVTPSILGKDIGLSAVKVNQKLESLGYQVSTRDHKDKLVWIVTDKGKPHCQMIDTNKRHNDGSPVMQIKWSTKIKDILK